MSIGTLFFDCSERSEDKFEVNSKGVWHKNDSEYLLKKKQIDLAPFDHLLMP